MSIINVDHMTCIFNSGEITRRKIRINSIQNSKPVELVRWQRKTVIFNWGSTTWPPDSDEILPQSTVIYTWGSTAWPFSFL